ncbi:hypothetical protein FQA39_LY07003 [Lamprigera yunnana]|nr:hypothetical protein FQA39_LY07003 [Lamprigera yunnana]
MKFIVLIFLFSSQPTNYITALQQSLNGASWRLENNEKGYDVFANVPGGVYTDLMNAKVIDEVFYGFNDMETRWVSKVDWNYSTTFIANDEVFAKGKVDLVFEGIDTFSTIYLNDDEVGSTENMFVRYIFDVKSYLKKGQNSLQLRFKSPVNEAERLFLEQSKNYSIVPLCVPKEYNGECHVNHIRKTQASFSWDWGPALPSMGIWKRVYFEGYDTVVIRDVTIKIEDLVENSWNIKIFIYLDGCEVHKNGVGFLQANLHTDLGIVEMKSDEVCKSKNSNEEFVTVIEGSVDKSHVKLWWPNGYGNANLYVVNVFYWSKMENSEKTFKIGFRSIELVQDEVDGGLLFYFKVNSVPIFAKGSNSIPISILPELSQSKDVIKNLLETAKEVNMNMVRVWGGGNYEADVFYELADEYGILIWQDFMFACNMYPATDKFLRNVENEVRHQVRRLQHHASIILWAGNNENEAALRQNWYGTQDKFDTFKADYKKLYVDTIARELLLNDDTRPFLASSPSNGIQSIKEDYVAINPQSNYYGDIHFYNYIFDGWSTTTYPIPRFSSEYGYQSLPSIDTMLTATNNTDDLMISSEFLEKRQHLPQGFDKMTLLINYRLMLPDVAHKDYYKAYFYYSQIIQAMAVKIETEHNRQWRSTFDGNGLGHVMGSLYWQLNDVWVAPSWSGIDFKGNWKMMQYFSKHFFAPVIITGDLNASDDLNVYLVSDLTHTIFDVMITISVYKWELLSPLHNRTIKTDIRPNQSEKLLTIELQKYLSDIDLCGADPMTNCFVHLALTDEKLQEVAPSNYVFPIPLKDAILHHARVEIRSITEHQYPHFYFSVEVVVDKIALFVWLEVNNISGRFSDNGFLQITKIKTVTFVPIEFVSYSNFSESLTVTHLMTYQ